MIMTKVNNFTPLETVLDINHPRLWYYIPGYNGYEVSDDGYVRSMKHFKRYPYGLLIQAKVGKKSGEIYFEMSDDNNIRKRVSLNEIKHRAANNQYTIGNYPRRTCVTDLTSRNKILCRPYDTVTHQRQFVPKFTIIEKKITPVHFNEPRPCFYREEQVWQGK